MIRAVLLDMDGVLFDTEMLGFQAMSRITVEYGRPIDLAFYCTTLGLPEAECRKVYFAAMGADFPYDEALKRFLSYFSRFDKANPVPRKKGFAECLTGLKARGLKIALATSTIRPLVNRYFSAFPDVAALLDGMVCGGEVPHGKPAPDAYIAAARAVDCEPSECAGVEDSLNGLRALRASGARCVMIPDLLPFEERFRPYVDDCLTGLAELCPLIDRLNRAE